MPLPAPLRVLVVAAMWPRPGAPHLGAFVARQVDALRHAGALVQVAAPDPRQPADAGTLTRYGRLLRGALDTAARFRPDVILAHVLIPTGAVGLAVARRHRIPLVVAAHGTDVEHAARSRPLRRVIQTVLDGSAACIAASPPLAARLGEACRLRRPAIPIDVGVDLRRFRPDGPALTVDDAVRPLIVQAGHLEPWKNPERLAAAVRLLREREGRGELWLAGSGSLERRLAGQPGVRVLGPLDPDDVAWLYRAADVAALVSLREGYGLAALEAVACGTPLVVGAGIPAAADLPADVAVVVDQTQPAEIAAGLAAALQLPRAPASGREVARAHGLERQTGRVLEVLERVVREASP